MNELLPPLVNYGGHNRSVTTFRFILVVLTWLISGCVFAVEVPKGTDTQKLPGNAVSIEYSTEDGGAIGFATGTLVGDRIVTTGHLGHNGIYSQWNAFVILAIRLNDGRTIDPKTIVGYKQIGTVAVAGPDFGVLLLKDTYRGDVVLATSAPSEDKALLAYGVGGSRDGKITADRFEVGLDRTKTMFALYLEKGSKIVSGDSGGGLGEWVGNQFVLYGVHRAGGTDLGISSSIAPFRDQILSNDGFSTGRDVNVGQTTRIWKRGFVGSPGDVRIKMETYEPKHPTKSRCGALLECLDGCRPTPILENFFKHTAIQE